MIPVSKNILNKIFVSTCPPSSPSKYIIYIGSHTPLHRSLPDIEASPEIL
jgi:hypothetical protein